MEDLQWVAASLSPGRGGRKRKDCWQIMSDCQVKSGREEVRVERLLPRGRVFRWQTPTQMAGLIWGGRNKQLRNWLFLLESDKLKTKSATQVLLFAISFTRLVVGYPGNHKTNSIAPYLDIIWTCFLSATVKKMVFIFTSAHKRWSLRGGKATVPTVASWGPEKNVRTIFRWLSENQWYQTAEGSEQQESLHKRPKSAASRWWWWRVKAQASVRPSCNIEMSFREESGIERKILPSLQPLVNGFRICWLPELACLRAHVASVNTVFNLFKPACLKTRLRFSAVCR